MAWTTFEDVTDRWVGIGSPTDETLVNALINDAETVILAAYPKIQDRIDDKSLAMAVVKMVVVRMVSRVLRNPENLSYWQQQTGPFGQARNFGTNTDIWLSEDEKTLLAPNIRGKAFEIDLAPNATSPYITTLMNGDGYIED